jgi:hypothetical protein
MPRWVHDGSKPFVDAQQLAGRMAAVEPSIMHALPINSAVPSADSNSIT